MSTRPPEVLPIGPAGPWANDGFKRRYRVVFRAALVGAVLVHAGLFIIASTIEPVVEVRGVAPAEMRAVALVPAIEMPTPPRTIAAPPAPVIAPPPALSAASAIPVPDFAEDRPAIPEIPPPPPLAEAAAEELAGFRHIMPYMVKPELLNRDEVRRALERRYPRALRMAGVEGQLLVWFWIDETGAIRKYEIKRSSGHPGLDDAAVEVIDIMEFSPALHSGRPVKVIVMLPIRFRLE